MEPSLESIEVAKVRQLSPRRHEGVLARIGRLGLVSEDRRGQPIRVRQEGHGDRVECPGIAITGSPNEPHVVAPEDFGELDRDGRHPHPL